MKFNGTYHTQLRKIKCQLKHSEILSAPLSLCWLLGCVSDGIFLWILCELHAHGVRGWMMMDAIWHINNTRCCYVVVHRTVPWSCNIVGHKALLLRGCCHDWIRLQEQQRGYVSKIQKVRATDEMRPRGLAAVDCRNEKFVLPVGTRYTGTVFEILYIVRPFHPAPGVTIGGWTQTLNSIIKTKHKAPPLKSWGSTTQIKNKIT